MYLSIHEVIIKSSVNINELGIEYIHEYFVIQEFQLPNQRLNLKEVTKEYIHHKP